MSAFIGKVNGPHHNSPKEAAAVWCSPGQVELTLADVTNKHLGTSRNLDPIAARNLAALLVRASEEAERMGSCSTEPPLAWEKKGKSARLCIEHGGVGFQADCTECQGEGVSVP